MKKFISLTLAVIIIAASFSACSSKPNAELTEENVTKTVDTVFDALKKVDTKALDTYVLSGTLGILVDYTEKQEQFKELGTAIFSNLSYEVKSVDLENKTVTLSVINKDLADASEKYTKNLLKSYSKLQLLHNLSDEKWLNNNLSKLTSEIENAKMKETPAEITISFQQNKKNLVLLFDEVAENEVSGGALGAIKNAVANQ